MISAVLIYTILTAVVIGIIAAIVLYFASVKFKVIEDPKIDEVEEILPASNCGGCGYPGCRPFAEACTKADNLDDLYCTVGGNDLMKDVAGILGLEAVEKERVIAVLRCNGSTSARAHTNEYDGAVSCTVASNLYSGETGCEYGCVGLGECVEVCDFDALGMNPETGLPEVNEDNCTACNACVEACPKDLFELRPIGKGRKHLRVYVACMNEDKGAIAKKACDVACIGCSKCAKVCPTDAITVENMLAYIDPLLCTSCRKCVDECPTNAILDVNFPPRKPKAEKPKAKAAKPAAKPKTATAVVEPAAEMDLTKMVKEEPKKEVEKKSPENAEEAPKSPAKEDAAPVKKQDSAPAEDKAQETKKGDDNLSTSKE